MQREAHSSDQIKGKLRGWSFKQVSVNDMKPKSASLPEVDKENTASTTMPGHQTQRCFFTNRSMLASNRIYQSIFVNGTRPSWF